jgi:NAD+ kinase
MKTISIIAKPHGERVQQTLEIVCSFLASKNINILLEEKAAAVTGTHSATHEEIREKSDLIVVLGGDGTLISAVRILGRKETPVLGVNLGRLGFLTETRVEEVISELDNFLENNYKSEKRMKLHCHLEEKGERILDIDVLNDVVINKSDLARIIEMELFIDGSFVNRYRSDGLIISTPTGSTAYNLSAGGPIVHPETETITISPICPHALTNRPIVISDKSDIEIRLRSKNEKVSITFDGQICHSMTPDTLITIRKASSHTTLVVPKDKNYFTLLREKLSWGDV